MNDEMLPLLEPLLKLMDKHDPLELEIAREGVKIRLKKKYEGARRDLVLPAAGLAPVVGGGSAGGGHDATRAAEGLVAIKSPMVGTFYRQPSPDSPLYCDTGDDVKVGQVVCIIEAMKVFNEIKAEIEGEVVEILVGNGEPVEYNQPLFLLKPKG